MKAYYGYKDGSGVYYIIIDTDKCVACGDCVDACPEGIIAIEENEFDIEAGDMAVIKDEFRNKIKYVCASCKKVGSTEAPPCIAVCQYDAIEHTW